MTEMARVGAVAGGCPTNGHHIVNTIHPNGMTGLTPGTTTASALEAGAMTISESGGNGGNHFTHHHQHYHYHHYLLHHNLTGGTENLSLHHHGMIGLLLIQGHRQERDLGIPSQEVGHRRLGSNRTHRYRRLGREG